jgi:hypothetical protein
LTFATEKIDDSLFPFHTKNVDRILSPTLLLLSVIPTPRFLRVVSSDLIIGLSSVNVFRAKWHALKAFGPVSESSNLSIKCNLARNRSTALAGFHEISSQVTIFTLPEK